MNSWTDVGNRPDGKKCLPGPGLCPLQGTTADPSDPVVSPCVLRSTCPDEVLSTSLMIVKNDDGVFFFFSKSGVLFKKIQKGRESYCLINLFGIG